MAYVRKTVFRSDQDYIDHGVEPPEHIPHKGSESVKQDYHTHSWVAKGNFLHCDQGQNGHGMPFDHLKFVLVGTSSTGVPIMKELDFSKKIAHSKNTATPSD